MPWTRLYAPYIYQKCRSHSRASLCSLDEVLISFLQYAGTPRLENDSVSTVVKTASPLLVKLKYLSRSTLLIHLHSDPKIYIDGPLIEGGYWSPDTAQPARTRPWRNRKPARLDDKGVHNHHRLLIGCRITIALISAL